MFTVGSFRDAVTTSDRYYTLTPVLGGNKPRIKVILVPFCRRETILSQFRCILIGEQSLEFWQRSARYVLPCSQYLRLTPSRH